MKVKQYGTPKSDGIFFRLYQNIINNSIVLSVHGMLSLFCLGALIYSAIRGDRMGILNSFLSLVLFFLPALLEEWLRIKLSTTLKLITMLFIFCSQILGEVGMYYARFPLWDDLLHWINGFLFAAFGFSLAEICNRRRRATFCLSPFYLALVACCFSLSIGVLWEFLEFAVDMITRSDMQKDMLLTSVSSGAFSANGQTPVPLNGIAQTLITTADGQSYTVNGYLDIGLIDTMKDLIVDFVGALIFSIIGYCHLKQIGPHRLADALIPKVPPIPATPDKRTGRYKNKPQ